MINPPVYKNKYYKQILISWQWVCFPCYYLSSSNLWNVFECVVRLNSWEEGMHRRSLWSWDEIGGISVNSPFLKWTVACLQRWLLSTSTLLFAPTDFQMGGYLFFFTGFNLGMSPDPSRRCGKRHWTSSRVCLLRWGSFSFSFTPVKTLLQTQPRCYGSPSFIQNPEGSVDILTELSASSQLPAASLWGSHLGHHSRVGPLKRSVQRGTV